MSSSTFDENLRTHDFLCSGACQLDCLNNGGIVILRLVDTRRDRLHPHRLGWEWPHQLTRIGLVAQQWL